MVAMKSIIALLPFFVSVAKALPQGSANAQGGADAAAGMQVPDVNVPDVNAPDVNVPDVNVPDVNVPDVNVPDVRVPDVPNLPNVPNVTPNFPHHGGRIGGSVNGGMNTGFGGGELDASASGDVTTNVNKRQIDASGESNSNVHADGSGNGELHAGFDADLEADMQAAGVDPSRFDLYRDKNPDYDIKIDPTTCKGNSEIALMKWRAECKGFNAVFRHNCYSYAPSERMCCPLAKRKSCEHYWPAKGEWAECLRMRKACGRDCEWKQLTGSLQWCWKYAPDI